MVETNWDKIQKFMKFDILFELVIADCLLGWQKKRKPDPHRVPATRSIVITHKITMYKMSSIQSSFIILFHYRHMNGIYIAITRKNIPFFLPFVPFFRTCLYDAVVWVADFIKWIKKNIVFFFMNYYPITVFKWKL